MTLRDAIKDRHDRAEAHSFVRLLLSGQMPLYVYSDYLINQYFAYQALEERARQAGILDGLDGIERADRIMADFRELGGMGFLHSSTYNYLQHLKQTPDALLVAHMYVRHMGDLYGGQMIRRVVPGSGSMYEFAERSALIALLRERLSHDLADEANRVFDFQLALFDELSTKHAL